MKALVCSTCGVVYPKDNMTVCPTCKSTLLEYEWVVKNCDTCKYREIPFYFNPCRNCGDSYTNWEHRGKEELQWEDIDA